MQTNTLQTSSDQRKHRGPSPRTQRAEGGNGERARREEGERVELWQAQV